MTWSQPQDKQHFSGAHRIRATREFREVVRGTEKVSCRGLSLFMRRRGSSRRRLGLAVRGQLGGAVVRNRIKRRLREYFRLHRSQMPQGIDVVVVAERDISGVSPETFQAIVGELYRRAGLFRHPSPQHAKEIVHTHN